MFRNQIYVLKAQHVSFGIFMQYLFYDYEVYYIKSGKVKKNIFLKKNSCSIIILFWMGLT